MTTWSFVIWCGIFFLGGAATAFILLYRVLSRFVDARLTLEGRLEALRTELTEVQEDAHSQYQGKMVALQKLNDALSVNDAFQRSRDEIWDLYRRSSLMSGNAQAWLSRELENAHRVANVLRAEKGLPPLSVPAGLVDVLEDHKTLAEVTMPTGEKVGSSAPEMLAGGGLKVKGPPAGAVL